MLEKLFVARKRLYPQSVKGKIRSLKWLLNSIFLSIYLFTPFLRFDRGEAAPNQAILIDIPNSKIFFFFIEIWPEEIYYLAAILVIAAIALFFVTSLFGRIWCGYSCFQTVWTDIFIAVEHLFQGDRNQRIILDRKKNFEKFFRKSLTHLTWIVISLITGIGFTTYFNDSFELLKNLANFNLSLNILGWISGIAFMTYIMAGFAREHVCTYMCPYSRFQSAMFDSNTLIITYDQKRGEPRQKFKTGDSMQNRGHCIDCKQCVVVCPTGIDIRQGLQMECIACGLCIDACDNIMEKIGLPKGLIRYDTLKNLEDPKPQNKFKIFRPRTFLYSAILTVALTLIFAGLGSKSEVKTSITPKRNPTFVLLSNGSIRNDYDISITNKSLTTKSFSLQLSDSEISAQNLEIKSNQDLNNLVVKAQESINFRISVIAQSEFLNSIKDSENRFLVNIKLQENAVEISANNLEENASSISKDRSSHAENLETIFLF